MASSLDYFSDPRLHGSLGVGLAALVGGATGIALRIRRRHRKATRARAATRAAPPAATPTIAGSGSAGGGGGAEGATIPAAGPSASQTQRSSRWTVTRGSHVGDEQLKFEAPGLRQPSWGS